MIVIKLNSGYTLKKIKVALYTVSFIIYSVKKNAP